MKTYHLSLKAGKSLSQSNMNSKVLLLVGLLTVQALLAGLGITPVAFAAEDPAVAPQPSAGVGSASPKPTVTPSAAVTSAASGTPGTPVVSPSASPTPMAEFPKIKPAYYSNRIMKFVEKWPPPTLSLSDGGKGEIIRAIKTTADSDIIGMVKHVEFKFPFKKVLEVNENYEDTVKIWADIQEVKVLGRKGNQIWASWVRNRPAFFLPKVTYEMITTVDRSIPGRIIYHNQLVDGNLTHSSDSVVVAEDLGPERTRISVLNFFTPAMGGFRALAEGRIWRDSIKNGYKDDVAFRFRLEHPDWDVDKINDESEKVLDKQSWDTIEYTDLLKFE